MTNYGLHILRLGMAITFIWIGVLIFMSPAEWGSYVQPWIADLMPVPIEQAMIGTAVLDVAVGFFLLMNVFPWLAALVGALHLVVVIVTVGINAVTVRDIGLLFAVAALSVITWPQEYYFWRRKTKEKE